MENKYDLINSYLEGEMSVKEQMNFENLLRSDAELMKEFTFRKKLNEAISENDVMQLRDKLSVVIKSDNQTKRRKINPYVLSTVAAVIIILIVVSSIFLVHPSASSKDLYNQFYQKYPSVVNSRSASELGKGKLFIGAFKDYESNNYERASIKMYELLEQDSENNLLLFYLSLCELEQNNLKQSEKLLIKLSENTNNIFWEQAHWYLALNYIKQDNKKAAKKILKKIIDEDFSKQDSAKILLEKMD